METFPIPRLDATQLRALAESSPLTGCEECGALNCPGWEAMSAAFDESRLRRLGHLAAHGGNEMEPEPTFAEHHPDGTRYW